MNYYISSGTQYYCQPRSAADNELYHYGVPGMKWGRRKAQPVAVGRTRRVSNPTNADEAARREARKAKAIKAAKIGAVIAGTALAAYGGYKLAKYVQGKRNMAAFKKAQDYVDRNVLHRVGDSTFKDGTHMMEFSNRSGSHKMTTRGARSVVGKAAGQHNANVMAKGRQMYKDATNTRLDRGLARVVNAGDAVGNTAKRAATSAGNAVKSAGNKAKNAVLDVVNPIYEYTPGSTSSRSRDYGNGVKLTESVTNYVKRKKKR